MFLLTCIGFFLYDEFTVAAALHARVHARVRASPLRVATEEAEDDPRVDLAGPPGPTGLDLADVEDKEEVDFSESSLSLVAASLLPESGSPFDDAFRHRPPGRPPQAHFDETDSVGVGSRPSTSETRRRPAAGFPEPLPQQPEKSQATKVEVATPEVRDAPSRRQVDSESQAYISKQAVNGFAEASHFTKIGRGSYGMDPRQELQMNTSVHSDDVCDPNCIEGQGYCQDKICFCRDPFVGLRCEKMLNPIQQIRVRPIVVLGVVCVAVLIGGVAAVLVHQLIEDTCHKITDKDFGKEVVRKEIWKPTPMDM